MVTVTKREYTQTSGSMTSLARLKKRYKTRGRDWEYETRDILFKLGYTVRRYGTSSVALPDIAAVKGDYSIGIECKSTITDHCDIPSDQLKRCFYYAEMYSKYIPQCYIAFKFGRETRHNKAIWEQRFIYNLPRAYAIFDIRAYRNQVVRFQYGSVRYPVHIAPDRVVFYDGHA